MTPKRLTNFRIDSELLDGLDQIRQRDGVPVSEQVRRAIAAWLKEKGVTAKTPPASRERSGRAGHAHTGGTPRNGNPMVEKRHPRHPKEHDLLKAIRRTPPNVAGELPAARRRAPRKPKPSR